MKIRFTAIFVAALFAVSGSVLFGQNQTISAAAGDKYVISAKAGGVNYTEGTVGIVRKQGKSGRLLKGDRVEIGDRVSTSADGRVEILLNPGSYLRLGGESAFEFKTTSLDDLQINIHQGSAILEVFAGNEFVVTLFAPKAKFKIVRSGVYRLDVSNDGSGTLAVWKGRAEAENSSASIIKAGKSAVVSNSQVTIAKFDRNEKDAFELWSKDRAKQLAKLTDNLQKRDVRNSLLTSFAGRRWNMYDSFGLWVFDRFSGTYCFLPFGNGWYSPYGYNFGHSIWSYNLPWAVYNTPPPWTTTPPSGQPAPGPVNTPILSRGDRSPVPPFVRMQGTSRIDRGRNDDGGFEPNPSPTYSRPVYSPPPATSAPPPGTGSKPSPPFTRSRN